jgi:TonB family protein
VEVSEALAVRLANRYINAASALSIAQTGKLELFVMAATVCSLVAAAGVVLNASLERHRPHHHMQEVDVAFELQCAPPEPSFRTVEPPEALVPLRFEEGSKPAPKASAPADDVRRAGTVTAEKPAPDTVEPTDKVAARAVPEEAPIAVTSPVIPSAPPARPITALLPNPFTGNAANAATPPPSAPAGGEVDGAMGATGAGGTGAGTGGGDPNALAGGDFGVQNGVSTRAPAVAMGNIGPYKRDLVARLRSAWHPDQPYESVTVDLAVDHGGKVLEKKILVSSGNEQLDESLLKALDSVEMAALPDWYRGQQLHIKLVLRNT